MKRVLVLLAVTAATAGMAWGTIIYNDLPGTIPATILSALYAPGTTSLGDAATLACSPCSLGSAQILIASGAEKADFPGVGTSSGFNVAMTLNVYAVGPAGSEGALEASATQMEFVPWDSSTTSNGTAEVVGFNFGGVTVGSNVIWTLAFGNVGPAAHIGLGLLTGAPSVGSDPAPPGSLWVNGVLGQTLGAQYAPGAEFSTAAIIGAAPEPGTMGVGLVLVVVLALFIKKRRR